MPALLTTTMVWDSNITKVNVTESGGIEHEFTSSGSAFDLLAGRTYTSTVTLNTGYILDTVTSNNTNVVISDITENTFICAQTGLATPVTINITSKSNVSKVSIDLTTLTGWDNVSSGEHQISVVAKATGYLDSEKSTAVSFTKASASTGETWVLNDILHFGAKSWSYNVNFTSNGNSYSTFAYNFSSPLEAYLVYGSTNVYNTNSYWINTAYKTITFDTAPTGDLLTWLQANGTKQGGGETTSHKLTWSDSTMAVTVNGNAATSPYTLANGDKIVLKRTSGYQSYNIITNTGSFDTDTTQSPLAVNNSDIKLQNGDVEKSPSMVMGFTINYTE